MSLRDVCDVAYVLLADQVERRCAAMVQAAATLRAAGADMEIPSFADERDRFDAALIAAPVRESAVASLIRELGVA